jgi:hypothetical protein
VKVLLVVIDAASPRVVCPAIQTGSLPTLHRLAEAGAMHQASATIFPSITPAATTSIVTGCYPAEHGIAGASWFDEARQEVAYYGDDFWVIAKEGFGAFLRDFLVRLNGDRLTAPTLFELVERTGRSAACLNYLVYRGLVRHRVQVPLLLTLLPGVPMTETVDGPRTLCLGQFVSEAPVRHKSHAKAGLLHRFGMDDEATAELLLRLVEAGPLPDFTVAYFADNDYVSHDVGPHSALPVVERVDRALGAMFDAAGGLDRFLQDHCVIVTSDHGHCDILPNSADAAIDLQMVLADFRQAALGKAWRDQDQIMICPNMRAAQIYSRETSAEAIATIAHTCLQEPRVDLVVWKHSAAGRTTYTVWATRGRLEFWRGEAAAEGGVAGNNAADAFGTAWRWRGDLEALGLITDGAVLESEEYPNAFERLAGALDARHSGEVWVTAQPGCEFQLPGNDVHVGGGSHGALHALDTLCPVIAAGGTIRLPRVMRSVDIAPLCMAALGLEMRYQIGDGRASAL